MPVAQIRRFSKIFDVERSGSNEHLRLDGATGFQQTQLLTQSSHEIAA
jgi:hypothetical protein